MNVKTLAFALSFTLALGAFATEYYVGGDNASDGNDGSASAPFATLDKAFDVGGGTKGNNIYVRAGTYSTDKQYGYDLKANLIGDAATRDEVVIQSAGNHRTLRMNATDKPTVTKVTIVGCTDISKVDKGGAIEMNGGTLRDCVIRDGKTYGHSSNLDGGNIYMAGDSLVEDCLITGGEATKRGGNVYLDNGTIRNCTITGGSSRNVGGNIYMSNSGTARVIGCLISGGVASQNGGNICFDGGQIVDSIIRDGTANGEGKDKGGGNIHISANDEWNGYGKGGLISRCRILNGGTGRCGGILSRNSAVIIEDCLIAGNQNGGVMLEGADMQLINNTIANNAVFGITGYGSASSRCKIVNCAFYGNKNGDATAAYTGTLPSTGNMIYCAFDTNKLNSVAITAEGCLTSLSGADFVDVGNDDFTVATGSILIDAGTVDPRGAAFASATDLAGNPRMSGPIDIGCYEYQKPDMTIRIESASFDRSFAPAVVTFSHVVENSISPENVVFTYAFGDGSEVATTKELTLQHAYAKPGVYTVTITAVNECAEERAEMTYEGYVRVGSSTVYVNAGNKNEAFPYDTLETGYANLKTAIGAAQEGYTLLVGEGVYGSDDQTSISKALTIKGLGKSPEAVVLRNTTETPNTYYHRTLELKNNALWVENLTIENGRVKNQNGANVRLVGGVITNCVIRGGYVLTAGEDANGAGSAVELAGSGTLTHCVITNNIVDGTSSNQGLAGGAVFVTYRAKNGRVSNCLIAGNRYITSGDVPRSGTAGIRFGGENDNTQIENNTIVANVVEGSLSEDSAGLHCTTWYGRMRNNIIAGNYETGKAKYTSVKVDKDHCTFDNNLTDDATAYTSKSFAAPLATIFKDFAKGDYTLPPTSPACNKGTTTGLVLRPAVDLLGNPRVFGKAMDIGCYECQRLPGLAILIK